jgi:hypothetical protein
MIPRIALALLGVSAFIVTACDGDNARGGGPPLAATTEPTAVRGSSVIRLDTLEPVYEAFVTGRVPLGLVNEVTISLASADIDGFYIGEEFGQDLYLDLAIVASANRRDFAEFGGHSYEWWFASREQVGNYPLKIHAVEPELGIALRFVDGGWGLYVSEGAGWEPIDGTFTFGVHEVSAHVRIDVSLS